ncbi:MAG TPA: potassium-transporting ATPase subunit C [Terriglobia bacterium]|nr:potassium-transporting ATPase subunit C [Terriglobia bacterium]
MKQYVSKSVFLLVVSVILVCGIYPGALWLMGRIFFPSQASGSLVRGPDGKIVGSKLIAQPFTKDEYFWPRPSAASYDASASTSSALAASNYALRNRIATTLGPIVKYASGPKAGQLVAPDIEAWFQKDRYQGQHNIVAQWADAHNELAQAWITADPTHAAFVQSWAKANPGLVKQWIKANPATPNPQPTDLAVVFFENFSKDYPGKFPSAVTTTGPNGKAQTKIEPVSQGTDIQSIFFDMWRQDHPDVALQNVPGDMVTTSASGLDPNITMENAEYQLDRVATKWASDLKRDPATVRSEIQQILDQNHHSPLDGLAGERLINVLEVNLALREKYGVPPS